ncbi:MAG: sigma-54 dependent transcriptional regulator [Planctomycetota bacterium]
MKTAPPGLLLVEDQESMRQMLMEYLVPTGFEVQVCASADQALQRLRSGTLVSDIPVDVILTDVRMPGMDGLEFCRQVKNYRPALPVIVMTAYGSLDTAIDAIRAGAFDFVVKPVELELLRASLLRAAENSQLKRRVRVLEDQESDRKFPDLIGQSDVMVRLKSQLESVLQSSAPVLITGESGTGKEVVAAELHRQGPRSKKALIAVNCAALPLNLLESELFGHVKGAFTDARDAHEGLLVKADGGTLFLDEIGELPLEVQPKLLRVLEQKTVRPVGGSREIPIDVRIISATNRDLTSAMDEKQFREDLFYRINVLELTVPPLRSRGTDVLILARHFYQKFSDRDAADEGFDEQVLQRFLNYDWPGNVRELRNVVERAVVMASGGTIQAHLLPEKIRQHQSSRLIIDDSDNQPLATLETIQTRYIQYVLSRTGGNKSEAAKILGLDRKTLYRKLKEIDPKK